MQQEEVVQLYLDDIIPNRFQPREIFDERLLKELAVSIKEHGVIQPIIVRKVNDKYEIIAGERRYKASALAGLTKIPAIVRDLDDKEASKVALLENLQRKNLNPLEEARTYQKILELDEMTQESLAKTMGKSQSAVANKIRLLSLPEEVQDAVLKEQISERHARALLNVEDREKQKELLNEIISSKMTVRQLEERIKGDSNQSMEEANNIEQPSVPEQIGNDAFISNKPLMPSFTLDDEKKEEPFIMPSQENTNSIEDKEPMIINQPDTSPENMESTPKEPLFINSESTKEEPPANTLINEEPKEEEPSANKFINFGEIGDSDDSSDEDLSLYNEETPVETQPEKKDVSLPGFEPPEDISNDTNVGGINLDSLLNIGKPAQGPIEVPAEDTTPAEQAIQESEKEESDDEEYFKAPDLIDVNLPGQAPATQTNQSLAVPGEEAPPENKLNAAVNEIKQALEKVEAMGVKVEKDELNLSNSYQIVIKLEK